MLFLDGVYVDDLHKGLRFVRVKAPSHEELTALVGTIARRVGRKVFTVQTLPASDKTNDDRVGKLAG